MKKRLRKKKHLGEVDKSLYGAFRAGELTVWPLRHLGG